MARTNQSEQRADQEPTHQVVSNAAPSLHLKLVWNADGSEAPAALEPGAAPYLVAYHRGYMCGMVGQFEQAIGLFRETVALKPDFAEAHYNLGTVLGMAGQFPEAIVALHEAVALKPDFAEAHYNLGTVLGMAGQFPEAIVALREAVALKPDDAEAYHNLGWALDGAGQFPEAIAALHEAVALKPDYALAHSSLGWTLSSTGQFPEAIAALREAVTLKPDYALAYRILGWTLGMTGQFPEAIAACREAVALKPDDAEAHYNLGTVLGMAGQFPEAIVALREAVALKPDYALAHSSLGGALGMTGQFHEAIAVLHKARKIEPDINKQREITSFINEYIDKAKEFEFVESKKQSYTGGAPPPRPDDASQEGMGELDLNTKIKNAKAENLARAGARPATLQLATYRALLKNVDLLNPHLAEDERFRRAKRLVKAYGRVRERKPSFHDKHKQLRAAFNIVNAVQYQRTTKPKREAAQKLAIG